MTIEDILHKYCPQKHPAKGGACLRCDPFKPAMEDAKREGYKVALGLLRKQTAEGATATLLTLLESRLPQG